MSPKTRRDALRHRRSARPKAERMESRSLLNGAWGGYAGNAQHTALSAVASQPLEAIHWQTPVDLAPQFSGNDLLIHYGTPAITTAGTLLLPVKTGASGGFEVQGRNEQTGSLLYSIPTTYVLPAHDWVPSYSPALTSTGSLAMADIGGRLAVVDSPDSAGATISRELTFFGQANYVANPSAYNTTVFISTPITADNAGNVYFGFSVAGANPLNLQSGIARVAADGKGTYVSASAAASDGGIVEVEQNNAPAISNDGKTVYIAVSSGSFGRGDLLALDSTTLATKGKVALIDPKSKTNAEMPDQSTASPLVGPDGDVYFGVLENPFASNNDRGYLLHFNSDLSVSKTVGAFGWDDTPSIVPTSMIAGYSGPSTYLLMAKYNNYAGVGGDGVNRIAVLDPNDAATDPISGISAMRPVRSIAGATPDPQYVATHPYAVREWCINTAAVDPATDSILANSEDGKLYRWDLKTDTFSQVVTLTLGVGEAYTPTIIGPDGAVFAINNATLFAVGSLPIPTAADDAYSLNEDTSLTVAAPGVLANDTDGGGKLPITATVISGPAHGSLSLNPNGSFTYTPNALYSGVDHFTYTVSDGVKTSPVATATLTVNLVNHAPVAVPDFYTVAEDGKFAVTASGVLVNDTDVDPNTTLTASVVTAPTHGTLVLNSDGSFTYTPNPLYSGPDSFQYAASDGKLSSTATDNITVTPIDHPPVAVADSYTVAEDGKLAVPAAGVLANDTDVDPNTTLSALLVTSTKHGTLTFLADGSFTYTPTPLYFGSDSFVYRATDGQLTSDATATITVTATGHLPTTVDDSYTVPEEGKLSIAADGVLHNDTDPDPNVTLTAALASQPSNGTLVLNDDGSFTYTPNVLYRGTDSFTYRATNGALIGNLATVSIVVTPVNHPPVAKADTYVTNEDQPLAVFATTGVLVNDSDPDPGTTLRASLVQAPAHGTLTLNADGSFLYAPGANFNGTDRFTYRASDGSASSAETPVTLTVLPVNDLPVATGSDLKFTQGRASVDGLIVATFNDVDNEAASGFKATIDWGDGTAPSAGAVSGTNGAYSLVGAHVYDAAGSFLVTTTLADPGGGSVTVFSKATVAPLGVALTGSLQLSGNRAQDGAFITNFTTPTIAGTAPSGFLVTLFANPQGSATLIPVGQATAGADNTFRIVTNKLGDGAFALQLTAADPLPTSHLVLNAAAGAIDVDTKAPRIASTVINLVKGTATLTVVDDGFGLDSSPGLIPGEFTLIQTIKGHTVAISATVVSPTTLGSPLGPNAIALTFKKGHLPKGSYTVSVATGAIKDLAGNLLSGAAAAKTATPAAHPHGHVKAFRARR